jgi:uncharacterized lipoprotein YmbA
MRLFHPAFAALAMCLAACASTPEFYPVAAPEVTESIGISFRSVEVRDVSLPTYAASDEIAVEDASGKLITNSSLRWADTPQRAVSLELSGHLARLTGRRIASEPWPFEEFAQARLDVRFERLLAGADGQFHATGQYFVGVAEGGRERSGLFDLAVPFNAEGGPQAIAAARGEIIFELAKYIARNGL